MEIEAVMEKIWDIHDKLSDAIHSISRVHYLNSIGSVAKSLDAFPPQSFANRKPSPNEEDNHHRYGFVYVKDFPPVNESDSEIQEAKSLNAIRTALENLEDQLEFFHSVQTQQRAERDVGIARLEESRNVLAMRLAEHKGKKYKVVEEARAFVGNVMKDASCFDNTTKTHSKGMRSADLVKAVINGTHKSLKDQMGGLFGNAALIAISAVAILLQLHKGSGNGEDTTTVLDLKRNVVKRSVMTQSNKLDVMLSRG